MAGIGWPQVLTFGEVIRQPHTPSPHVLYIDTLCLQALLTYKPAPDVSTACSGGPGSELQVDELPADRAIQCVRMARGCEAPLSASDQRYLVQRCVRSVARSSM